MPVLLCPWPAKPARVLRCRLARCARASTAPRLARFGLWVRPATVPLTGAGKRLAPIERTACSRGPGTRPQVCVTFGSPTRAPNGCEPMCRRQTGSVPRTTTEPAGAHGLPKAARVMYTREPGDKRVREQTPCGKFGAVWL